MANFLHQVSPTLFLWPVALLGVVAMAIGLERFYVLRFRFWLAADPFMAAIQKHLLAQNLDAAVAMCVNAIHAPLASVVRAGLLRSEASREDLGLAIEQATADAIPAIQNRVSYLAAIANVVTLFGLLGTIVGLISSFDAVSNADPAERQTLLARGIALAMNTTAAGIAVAIPSLLSYSYLVSCANALVDDLERSGMKLQLLLHARKSAHLEPPPPEGAP